MSDAKFKEEIDWNYIQRKEVELKIKEAERLIANHSEVSFTEKDIIKFADLLRNAMTEVGILTEDKRLLFEMLGMKVWISPDSHVIELAIEFIPEGNTVSPQS